MSLIQFHAKQSVNHRINSPYSHLKFLVDSLHCVFSRKHGMSNNTVTNNNIVWDLNLIEMVNKLLESTFIVILQFAVGYQENNLLVARLCLGSCPFALHLCQLQKSVESTDFWRTLTVVLYHTRNHDLT